MVQSTIFDTRDKAKLEGMELSYRNSSTPWRRAVNDCIKWIIQTKQTFTADDIIMPLDAQGIVTKDNRALGSILTAWARAGLIESTGTMVKCKRPKRHSGYVMLWRVV